MGTLFSDRGIACITLLKDSLKVSLLKKGLIDMKELRMDLTNCYGIQRLDYTIDYSKSNVAVIYAPNGTMKSSLANTFAAVHEGEPVEERIFGRPSLYSFTDEKGDALDPDKIMVINPFKENSFDGQGLLMANEKLRSRYISIHKSIDEEKEKLYAEIKKSLGYTSKSGFDVKEYMLADWSMPETKEFECLEKICSFFSDASMLCVSLPSEIKYDKLFNEKAISMVKTGDTAKLLEDYEKQYNELIEKSLYMQKGVIDHNSYESIGDSLGTNGFFKANNKITLFAKDGSGSKEICSKEELDEIIREEKEKVLNTEAIKGIFEKINKALLKNKDTQAFATMLQDNPDLVIEYKDVDLFKKKVWVKVFKTFQTESETLISDVKKAQKDLADLNELAKKETTDWNKALDLFMERFYVPFSIKTANKEDVILKEAMPSFKYTFKDSKDESEVTKENLLDVLSTGERRAYYILNMVFQILVAEKTGEEYLLVLDDVSDSFDYRNKYAIIEYLRDISENPCFKLLLLTHNFDFYRTISSRIGKDNSLIGFFDGTEIRFESKMYTKTIFNYFKTCVKKSGNDNIVIASIPFVRNLIEYIEDDKNEDYLLLTNVLHNKANTNTITLKQIQDIFNKYWCKDADFAKGRENDKVIDLLMCEADKIADVEKIDIENKLILSMALRQKTEVYMKNRILNEVSNGSAIIDDIYEKTNQSAHLTAEFKSHFSNDPNMKLIEVVGMITPENIHLNSFMFEPILDMSLHHLYVAYKKACAL